MRLVRFIKELIARMFPSFIRPVSKEVKTCFYSVLSAFGWIAIWVITYILLIKYTLLDKDTIESICYWGLISPAWIFGIILGLCVVYLLFLYLIDEMKEVLRIIKEAWEDSK